MKQQQKYYGLNFTTRNCSTLQIDVLLRENLLQFKVPISSISMFAGVPSLIARPHLQKIAANLTTNKYSNQLYTKINCKTYICSIIEKYTQHLCSGFYYNNICNVRNTY